MRRLPLLLPLLLLSSALMAAPLRVSDDSSAAVVLQRPAQRIISLSPHVTELLYAAGGAGRVVGAVEYSDWPPAARTLPRVGDNRGLDLERIAALKPDLVVTWTHGNSARQLQRLRELGVPLFHSEPRTLEQVASSLERLGVLMGTQKVARPAAQTFRQRVATLQKRYALRPKVRLFYQVWDQPLMTLSGHHLVGDVMRVCGADNPFATLPGLAPVVDREAVIASNPELIVTGSIRGEIPAALLAWKTWPGITAVQRNNLFTLNADHMDRLGPRIIDGAEAFCGLLEQVRARRPR